MFNVIIILIAYFLDRHKLLNNIRLKSNKLFIEYIRIFTKIEFQNQRHIRYAYLYATLPIIILLSSIHILLNKVLFINYLIDMVIFLLTIDILRWRTEIDNNHNSDNFIIAYATKFFVPTFWFIVLPYGIGSTCYLAIMLLSIELKNKIADSVVYNTVVDKMLFYANVAPYFVLFFFIAIASNFENVFHYMIAEVKKLNKSFYALNNLLNAIILIAIDDNKFKNMINNDNLADSGLDIENNLQIYSNDYVKALLYRTGIFFIGVYSIIQFFRFVEFIIN